MLQKLRNVYLLKDVCDETLKEIAKYTSYLKLSKDNILFYEGEDSNCLFLLTKGIVKFYKTSSNNKEIIIKGEEAPVAEEVVEAPAEVAEIVEAPVAESTENKAE